MQNIYTLSTVDSKEYKSLICGRTNDVTNLLDHISRAHSVALFGERRIGKTSILYLIRDIINHDIEDYNANLLDSNFKHAIPTLISKVKNYRALYLDCSSLADSNSEALASMLFHRLPDSRFKTSMKNPETKKIVSEVKVPLVKLLEGLNNSLSNDERFVILLDEIDVFIGFEAGTQVFLNLRSVIQSCDKLCFLFAGADAWYREIKEKSSPLINNVYSFYLKAAEMYPVETYLLKNPLSNYLSPECDLHQITITVVEWTGCKPWYVQAICYEIVEACTESRLLPNNWTEVIHAKVIRAVEPTLRSFFTGENLDNISQKILALLSNTPNQTALEITNGLGIPDKIIRDKLDDLETLGKIQKQGSDYRIIGTLLEKWGKETQEKPKATGKWMKRLRRVVVILLLALAVGIYSYANPQLQNLSFAFPDGSLTIRVPASLESDEGSIAIILLQNTTASELKDLTLNIKSDDTDYNYNGTNGILFNSLRPAETKYWEVKFTARSPSSERGFSSSIILSNGVQGVPTTYIFEIAARAIPIKKFWGIISLLLVALSGYVLNPTLPQLAISLLSGLFKSPNNSGDK